MKKELSEKKVGGPLKGTAHKSLIFCKNKDNQFRPNIKTYSNQNRRVEYEDS